jgi:hypothetical protein
MIPPQCADCAQAGFFTHGNAVNRDGAVYAVHSALPNGTAVLGRPGVSDDLKGPQAGRRLRRANIAR